MKVGATWNRRFPGFSILAFADYSYLVNVGSDRRVAFMTFGWYHWHPDFFDFPRYRVGPWFISRSTRFRRMSHIFEAAAMDWEARGVLTAEAFEVIESDL